ncbi:hypothetical protein DPX16_23117 [Anabarilius grahami]|uniref:THD domain-containing protein n=1 Tax=Anabarilius grahami TaxID=495550 RepID=A0A3N0XHP1_ANAGA|nr:hypothetical protein DPX16_23117 [Anabarilius grahami]
MARVEMSEFGVEQEQMMQVLIRHCQTMKRQETRLRLATAALLATFLATLLWLQFQQLYCFKTTKDSFSGAHSEVLNTEGLMRHILHLEGLTSARNQFGDCSEEQPIKWDIMNDDNDSQNFKLENQTVLHFFTKGLYLINLRFSYRIVYNQCDPSELLTLEVNVTEKHSNYKKERVVISGTESMICRNYSLQSITLNQVILLESETSLRVKINKDSCKFVSKGNLDVTSIGFFERFY